MTPDSVRTLLEKWFAVRSPGAVVFREDLHPASDGNSSYVVAYEAVFEPPSPAQAYVEIWITTGGETAVGFERISRIAARLGVRRGRDRFVAGHEPMAVSEGGLVAVLDLIAAGDVAVAVTAAPVVGVVRARAIVVRGRRGQLRAAGYTPVSWLHELKTDAFPDRRGLLRFQPW